MNRLPLALLLSAFYLVSVHPPAAGEELFIASWNVENLFDTKDDPSVKGDEDFTPESAKHWTKERLEFKLKNLAKTISKMNDGKGPDVLGICEVENRDVIEMLVEKLKPLGRKYEIIHKDSPSERGIDCAIVYDSAVFTSDSPQFHHVDADNTRDIVEAKLKRNGNDLYVFVNHWPSRYHEESYREKAADVLRKRVDQILAADKKADIIMLGDFNDHSEDTALRDRLRAAKSDEGLPADSLLDTTAHISDGGKGTFVYNNKWDLLDHIIISTGLLDPTGYHWKKGSSQRIEYPELIFHPRGEGQIDRPNQSYTRNNFHPTGYSDHLPVGCVLVQ